MSGRLEVCFIGQNLMGDAALHALREELTTASLTVITRPSTAMWTNPVIASAAALDIPILLSPPQEEALGGDPFLSVLANADIAFCCGWPTMIGPVALDAPRRGIINLHPGALPSWRGSDPLGWHLAAGLGAITCTVHGMTLEVDAGPVLARATVAVGTEDTGATLRTRCGRRLGTLAADIAHSPAQPIAAHFDDSRVLPPRGTRPAFDPADFSTRTARRVIQAFSPYPGAVVRHDGRWAEVTLPVLDESKALRLACCDGSLSVEEVTR